MQYVNTATIQIHFVHCYSTIGTNICRNTPLTIDQYICTLLHNHPFTDRYYMMTSSNGNIFRVTGPLCWEVTGPGEFPTHRSVTRSFDVFIDLRLNKRLSKQPWGWWFETLALSLWRQCNVSYIKIAIIGWISNYIHVKQWYIIIHIGRSIDGGIDKTPLGSSYG